MRDKKVFKAKKQKSNFALNNFMYQYKTNDDFKLSPEVSDIFIPNDHFAVFDSENFHSKYENSQNSIDYSKNECVYSLSDLLLEEMSSSIDDIVISSCNSLSQVFLLRIFKVLNF